ncbi:hypothetical protein B0H11DRAFT_2231800 [Mycena galericulata]|nr:hypothetical protein B0H11DRAFT_2231800 [Mycena galericulata]
MSSQPDNTSATATESLAIVSSVAAAAVSPAATPAQRQAALQYLATLVNAGGPVQPSPTGSTAPPVYSVAAPAGPAGQPPSTSVADPTLEQPAPYVAGILYAEIPTSYLPSNGVVDNGQGWYAVFKGRKVGITQNNAVALEAVVGVSNNAMRSFKTFAAAHTAFNDALASGLAEIRTY